MKQRLTHSLIKPSYEPFERIRSVDSSRLKKRTKLQRRKKLRKRSRLLNFLSRVMRLASVLSEAS